MSDYPEPFARDKVGHVHDVFFDHGTFIPYTIAIII
jgi:hypothetical protein